ncbi:uclacyanin-3-like [Rhododendron vialii]|uniref:uclacyanin-3-like n=1 Tax=Rhododendron vialii TaxID=182163 RepID=UPI00266023DD|nr:uclacyanin-3-like [Rhododendron vialii]
MAMAMAALLLLVFLAVPAVHSVQTNVPWNEGIDYTTWAAGKTFTVGDTLVFVYTTNHAVDIVDESHYTSCNSGNALHSYSGGQTTITLTTPGPMYFLCPTIGHCQAGMKLSITVAAAASSSSGSSSTTSTTPAITTTTSSPTTSGVGGMFGNMNNWVVIGFSVVVAGFVGFMG